MYGTTENSPITFQTPLHAPFVKRATRVGTVLPHVEAKVVDERGHVVPLNERGELLIRGYGVMLGYYDEPIKTQEVIDDARWYRTGYVIAVASSVASHTAPAAFIA